MPTMPLGTFAKLIPVLLPDSYFALRTVAVPRLERRLVANHASTFFAIGPSLFQIS